MVEVSARGTGLKKVTTKLVMRHAHHPGTDPEEVTVLDLSNNEVSHVGESFGDSFPLVMELSLARNALFGLDARNLPVQLTRLSLAHNKLESVAFLSALPSLVDLDLSYNLLRSLDGAARPPLRPPHARPWPSSRRCTRGWSFRGRRAPGGRRAASRQSRWPQSR